MLPENFSLGRLSTNVLKNFPSFRFRDRDKLIHNASDVTKCGRAITYKALGHEESNPTDTLGFYRMSFGSWLESGLKYSVISKLSVFGVHMLAAQGDAGEHGTFYGTSWHGYRDFDIGLAPIGGGKKMKPAVIELKTKVGYGAQVTLKKSPWSKEYIVPTPDLEWGQSQQLSLYLRDVYRKTKDNPDFSEPIRDGIILQLLYADGLACFVEYFFEYDPEKDAAHCYKVHCEEHPESSGPLDIWIELKPIAERWKKIDEYVAKGELAPPDYTRKYDIDDDRVKEATKTDLDKAIKSDIMIGDTQCKYCPFRDKCSADLGIELKYSAVEVKALKKIVRDR